MSKDLNADGFCGALQYNRGHVTFKRSIWGTLLTVIAVTGAAFIAIVVVGAILNVNVAQSVLESLIAGKR